MERESTYPLCINVARSLKARSIFSFSQGREASKSCAYIGHHVLDPILFSTMAEFWCWLVC